ncbi:amino acid permease [Alicyclobacillus sp. SO9]|uniref:amino acid permease n=1 Tax=Alicyclobacillus sp. SO9 TaxID=2665646 RepID=UPI0018E8BF5E|nr:amino acid permease [Alicyclobacillus sp. SO9]QQE76921.1 amino acid permease [Alicyclobacillus sp. SO9]
MQKSKARLSHMPAGSSGEEGHGSLSTRELIFIGVGGIIGAGFFLGSGLPIKMAGPSVLLAFLLGAIVTAQVTGSLTSIAANHPVRGSFKVFADMYMGRFAGFLQGWTYYLTSILTISSEAVAMSVFSKLWFPHIASWILVSVYSAGILVLNAFGVKNFGKVESIMSVLKIGALAGFIIYLGFFVASRMMGPSATGASPVVHPLLGPGGGFFPHGFTGLMQSILIVIFAYAGIGVFGTAAAELKNPKGIDKAAWGTVIILAALYILSIGLLLMIEPWNTVSTKASPFVVAWKDVGLHWVASLFNGVVFVSSFSVMTGAVFSAGQILSNLGTTGEAPHFVTKRDRRGVEMWALVFTAACIAVAIGASYLLPSNVYSFLVSASSFFTFFNWFVILWTFLSWRIKTDEDNHFLSSLAFGQPISTVVTMLSIIVLTGYALTQHDQRVGFYFCAAVFALLSISYVLFARHSKAAATEDANED